MRIIDADALKEYVKIFDIGCGCDDDHHERFLDAIDDAPTIEPDPCEDAVSREEAKWVVFCNRDHVEDQANAIDELPSVMPKRKTGKWGEHGECPFCGYLQQWDDDKFCGNCGARLEVKHDKID